MSSQHPTAELLVACYCQGIFPMVDPDTGRVEYYSPDPRGILPLDRLHVSHSLARRVRSGRFEIRSDSCFERVMRECAAPRADRAQSWMNEPLLRAYVDLHHLGAAHSVEAWREGVLVGGLYGVHLGAAFFGESMFHRPELEGTDASKVCLVALVERLRECGFELLDTQFTTPHLERLGAIEVPRSGYLERLARALARPVAWDPEGCE
ncbi:MAG: leucyl/phenylalanyl-tRNA--protein transferase [Myxococcota bacterium]